MSQHNFQWWKYPESQCLYFKFWTNCQRTVSTRCNWNLFITKILSSLNKSEVSCFSNQNSYRNFWRNPEECWIWQYGLWSFQTGYTKLERFLRKNQRTQRKLLNFENWTNGEPQYLAKIRGFKVDYFDFSCIKLEKLCELDVRVIAYNF